MAQAVIRQPHNAEVWGSRPCCGGHTEKDFSVSSSVLPRQYHSTLVVHRHYHLGDERQARWWLQFREIISPYQHEQ
jgi:hypothetical protein